MNIIEELSKQNHDKYLQEVSTLNSKSQTELENLFKEIDDRIKENFTNNCEYTNLYLGCHLKLKNLDRELDIRVRPTWIGDNKFSAQTKTTITIFKNLPNNKIKKLSQEIFYSSRYGDLLDHTNNFSTTDKNLSYLMPHIISMIVYESL